MTEVIYPQPFDDADEYEAASRGLLTHVRIRVRDGRVFGVTFMDVVRLQQELKDLATRGEQFIAEVGLIVLTDVRRAVIEEAVTLLERRGYFEFLKPLDADADPWNI